MDETYCGDSTKTWFFPLGFSSSSICICTLHSLLLGKNLSYNYIYIHYLLSLINIEVLLFFQNYKTCWCEHHVALCLWTILSGLYTWELKFYECSVYFHIYSICELHKTKKYNSLNFYYLKYEKYKYIGKCNVNNIFWLFYVYYHVLCKQWQFYFSNLSIQRMGENIYQWCIWQGY